MADEIKEVHIGSIQKRLTGTKCPHCGRLVDGGTSLHDRQAVKMPKPGDFAVCLYCGSICAYTGTLALRRIERKEQREMRRNPRLAKLIELCIDTSKNYRRNIQ